MENKTEFIERESKQSHYDKRLINEVVKLVEEGTPRKEVNRIYHLGVSTLNGWMRDYGSASYHAGKKRSYTPVEKNKIIAEIEQGLSLSEIQKKYTVRPPVKTNHAPGAWIRLGPFAILRSSPRTAASTPTDFPRLFPCRK